MKDLKLSILLFEDVDNQQIIKTARNLYQQILTLFSNKPKEELIKYFSKDLQGRATSFNLGLLNKNLNNLRISIRDKIIYGVDSNVESELIAEDPEQNGTIETTIVLYQQFPVKTQESSDVYNQWLLNNFLKIVYSKQRFFINEFLNAYKEGYITYLDKQEPTKIKPKAKKEQEKEQEKEQKQEKEQENPIENKEDVENLLNMINKNQFYEKDGKKITKQNLKNWIAQIGINKLTEKYRKTMPAPLYKFFMKNLVLALKDSPVSANSHYSFY